MSAAPLLYAIGDIHGSLQKLCDLIAQCERHAGGRPATFVFLGDYIDRGPDSAGVIDTLMRLQSLLTERVIALKGNHEAVTIEVVDGEADEELWLREGGAATLRSYGVARASDCHARTSRGYVRCRFTMTTGGGFSFMPASIRTPLEAQTERDLLWIREPFLSYRGDYGRLVVHGHTPIAAGVPELRGNRLEPRYGAGPATAGL